MHTSASAIRARPSRWISLRAPSHAGADLLELGVPFSDPTADGPSIARASQRAIRAGGGLVPTLRAAKAIRARFPDIPIVLFGYYNPLFVYREDRVVREAEDAGIDALLVVDLPVEEASSLRAAAARARHRRRSAARADELARSRRGGEAGARKHPVGFVYYVSLTGVTGSSDAPLAEASAAAGRLRDEIGVPVVVGFGIDSAEKARAAAAHADGAVVGTAIVRGVESEATPRARKTP